VRKLGVPGQEELAMGAIASGGIRIVNDDVVEMLQLSDAVIDAAAAIEQEELERRETTYRHGRAGYDLAQHDVLLIDDGLATGASMLAAVTAVREQRPSSLTIAVPVAAPDVCRTLGKRVDAIVCLATPDPLYGVGFWYDDFEQTSDDEVRRLLDRARHWQHAA
jgi:putative phosphoribosyl transferase